MAEDQAGGGKRKDYRESSREISQHEDGGAFGGGFSYGRGRFSDAARGAGEEMLRGRHAPGSRDADD